MDKIFLHDHPDFKSLLEIIEKDTGILATLIEKDYWIMHCLYSLTQQGYKFQLKGGTSLSKGFGIIDRFSEDIDMHINPPADLGINENPKNSNRNNISKKKEFYDRLAKEINVPGIVSVDRDVEFDDPSGKYNSGGIRLIYKQHTGVVEGVKHGVLLEVGFDQVAPNVPVTISSWAYDKAKSNADLNLIDNRAKDILCYDPRYTFVEKLQAIVTKFRKEMKEGKETVNYMRQYYDVYSLLGMPEVVAFIGTEEYLAHKNLRFYSEDLKIPMRDNEAFLLSDPSLRSEFEKRYKRTAGLYYKGQPPFSELLNRIQLYLDKM